MAQEVAVLAQLVTDKTDLVNVLDNVCHLTQVQRNTLVDDGYDTARSLVHWNYKSIRSWCEAKSKLILNCGRCAYGDCKIKCVQALAYWSSNTGKISF